MNCHMFKTIEERSAVIENFKSLMDEEGYDVRIGSSFVLSKESCELPENRKSSYIAMSYL